MRRFHRPLLFSNPTPLMRPALLLESIQASLLGAKSCIRPAGATLEFCSALAR
jgi:hypothetical protein